MRLPSLRAAAAAVPLLLLTLLPHTLRAQAEANPASSRHSSRLFFAPTARAVPAGQGYTGVLEVVMPFVTLGVTDAVSVSGGVPFLPFSVETTWFVAPKVTLFQDDRTAVATGAYAGSDGHAEGAIVYAMGTFGDAGGAVTTALGWGINDSGVLDEGTLMVGGELRAARRLTLITENYVWPGGEALFSGGVRLARGRLALEAAAMAPVGIYCVNGCVYPLVNVVYGF